MSWRTTGQKPNRVARWLADKVLETNHWTWSRTPMWLRDWAFRHCS